MQYRRTNPEGKTRWRDECFYIAYKPQELVNNYYMLCYDQFDKAPSLNYLKVTPSKLTQSANDVYETSFTKMLP